MFCNHYQYPVVKVGKVFNSSFIPLSDIFGSEVFGKEIRVNISEDEKYMYIDAELPGIKKENVSVAMEGNVLKIVAERKGVNEESKRNFHTKESFYGSFSRNFVLNENISKESIEATFEDGVLRIVLQKIEPQKDVRQISVN